MAISITTLSDNNHSISASKSIIGRQSELGETLTVSIPVALYADYPLAYLMYIGADGNAYFIDNSGTPFDYAGDGNFTYVLGANDSMLEADGRLGIQVVLRDISPPNTTKEWRSRILYVQVENSIIATEDAASGMISALAYGSLGSITDVDLTGLADGDLLYRNSTTGKWEDLTLVEGAYITLTLNKTNGTLQIDASGDIATNAGSILYTDVGEYYAGSDGETIGQEIGASLVSKAPLASPTFTGTPTAPTAAGSTNTTQIATMAAVHAGIDADVGVANSADVKVALNASGDAPIYACRAWVNFNGTGTVAIRGSGNVSSITDQGTGRYFISFVENMPDTNYVYFGTAGNDNVNSNYVCFNEPVQGVKTVSGAPVEIITASGGARDSTLVQLAFLR